MQITEDNIVRVWLKARDLAEEAHLVVYHSKNDPRHEERMDRAKQALDALVKALDGAE